MTKKPNIYHPGKILKEEFLQPSKISPQKLAQDIQVDNNLLTNLMTERISLDSELAARLALYFQTDPYFWINLQRNYDEEKIDKLVSSPLRDKIMPVHASV